MADPLSIGASVAGLMSLAITACQSLAAYYASWRGYEKDIHTMCQYMKIVSNNMRCLEMCLGGRQFPADLRQQVETAIVACSDQINALDRELDLVKLTIPPESSQEKLKLYVQRAKYPFKEGTLKKIRDSLVSIQAAVDSSVNILGIDSLGSLNSTAMTIVTKLGDAKQNIENVSRDVPSILTAVNRIGQDLPDVCNEMVLVRSNVHGIKEDVQVMKNHLQKSEERLDVLPLIKDRIDTLPASLASSVMMQLESRDLERRQLLLGGPGNSEISEKIDALAQEIKRLQLHVINKPSLLREELDNASEDGFVAMDRRPKQSGSSISPIRLMKECTCRARVDSPRTCWISENFQIFTSVTKTHRTSCPFSENSGQIQTQTIGVRTILARRFFAKALEFSLGVTYGAGGCSLATSIRLRTLLRKNSPAFLLFSNDYRSLSGTSRPTDAQSSGYMMKVLQTLKVLFSDGKASPYDIDSQGRTILQSAICWMRCFRISEMGARSQSARKTLLIGLVQMGVPLDHKDFHDRDVLGELILTERDVNIIDPELHVWPSLIQLSPLTRLPGYVLPAIVFKVARDLEEYADLYDCGLLSTSILSRDQDLVGEILQKRPYLINERNSLGQSPLHLAASWPWATNRLLEAGASIDTEDNSYFRPLVYAAMIGCWIVFEKLLDSGSPILTLFYPRRAFQFDHRVFNLISNSVPPQTFDHICVVLADRRKRLMELAKQILNVTEYSNLVSSNMGLLDSKAGEVCKKILDGGYEIPPALQIPSHAITVYHTCCLNPAEMSKLYDAGFHEVDARDNSGNTPFMIVLIGMQDAYVGSCEWLISKGADPLGKLGQFGATHMHYLAVRLAHWAVQKLEVLHQKKQALSAAAFRGLEPGLRLINRHSSLTIRDHCQCGCSADGCSPLHLLLNHTLNYTFQNLSIHSCFSYNYMGRNHPNREVILGECMADYSGSLYYFFTWVLEFFYEDQGIPDSAYREVIQSCLFLELELTHTCLTLGGHFREDHLMPEEEIHEIQEEEREMLFELQTLCKEGSARWVVYEGLFYEFLEEFISEVRSRPRTRLMTEEISKIGEIGVVLEQE